MYHLSKLDISRLKRAVSHYREQTGSEYMYDQYSDLLNKLDTYEEQNLLDEG